MTSITPHMDASLKGLAHLHRDLDAKVAKGECDPQLARAVKTLVEASVKEMALLMDEMSKPEIIVAVMNQAFADAVSTYMSTMCTNYDLNRLVFAKGFVMQMGAQAIMQTANPQPNEVVIVPIDDDVRKA